MRVKALEVRRAKALTNKKSKLYKAQKDIEKQEEAKQFDEQIKKAKEPKPKPEPEAEPESEPEPKPAPKKNASVLSK
eukprot:745462-Hanusia_phi.AAC.1